MSTLSYLDRWRDEGAISSEQYDTLAALVRKDRFSVFIELNALLYAGVLAFVAGVGWTIQTYFASLGDAAILFSLATLFASCLYYCFSRSVPYSQEAVESPTFVFDYVLYFGCLIFGVGLGYLEFRYHFLKENWDQYLLLSAIVYFVLSYRFDNRFVLSLALSALAGWFGLRVGQRYSLLGPVIGAGSLRPYALAYGSFVAVAGTLLHRAGIKRHYVEAYLHVAANVLFIAVLSGSFDSDHESLYFLCLCALSGIVITQGIRVRRFAFVIYGVVYSYVGVSDLVMRPLTSDTARFAYFAVSGTVVVGLLVMMARRFGRGE
jgi:Predicted membrane protein (DUF2157)